MELPDPVTFIPNYLDLCDNHPKLWNLILTTRKKTISKSIEPF